MFVFGGRDINGLLWCQRGVIGTQGPQSAIYLGHVTLL